MTARAGPLLGIDIGGTKIAAGVVMPDGTVMSERRAPSRATDGPDPMIARTADLARAVLADAGVDIDAVDAVGIACGGPLDPWRGIVLNALNNPGWTNVPLVARIEALLGRPTYLENDANAAALGEHRFGAGRGTHSLVYLTISTGLGGGLVLEDRLYRGANGNAGELGHVSVRVDGGRPCHCGSVGCLEAYCSGTNIAARAREALGSGPSGALAALAPDAVDAAAVAEAARRGDVLARRVWDETMLLLGGGIASIVHAFNPELVVLGGGVTRAGDLLFEPVRRVVAERTMPWLLDAVRIVPAALGELTGVIGAASVAIERHASRPAEGVHG